VNDEIEKQNFNYKKNTKKIRVNWGNSQDLW
jgi:hypothetical protein